MPTASGLTQQEGTGAVVSRQGTSASDAETGRARILAVDDEPIIREVLCRILAKPGHEVICVESGEEAIELLRNREFDILLSDYDMPGMSGQELAEQAKLMHPGITAALVTGWRNRIREEDINASALDFVTSKPFRDAELNKIIAFAMSKRDGQAASDGLTTQEAR